MKITVFNLLILAIASLLLSCQSPKQAETESKSIPPPSVNKPEISTKQIECKSPRPEMCAQVYDPVCATRDTGVRCVTTPCPSTEQVTKSNACTACSDEKVSSYTEGACQ